MAHPVPARLNIARVTDDDRPRPGSRALLAERRRQAMRLRTAGLSVSAIALRLAADPEINSVGEAFPGGYGSQRYYERKPPPSPEQLRHEAKSDIALMYERARNSFDRDSTFMFDIAIDRIEAGILAIWDKVGNGSQLHVGRLWEGIELQARLMGWIKPPAVTVDTINLNAIESPQPEWDPEYLTKFFGAMLEAGAEEPDILELAASAVEELAPAAQPVDAVVVEDDSTSGP